MSPSSYVLSGERAALGTLRAEHAEALSRWYNDPEIRHALAHRGLVSPAGEERWIDEQIELARAPRPSSVAFAIHDREDGALVGMAGLEGIDWAFMLMGLHNVMLEVYDSNEQARRSYAGAGFREIGRRRGAAVTLGRRCDVILMDAAADDFDSPELERLR